MKLGANSNIYGKKNLPQGRSMDGENASMPSSPFECETSAQEEHHRIPKRSVPEEGAVSQASEKKQSLNNQR